MGEGVPGVPFSSPSHFCFSNRLASTSDHAATLLARHWILTAARTSSASLSRRGGRRRGRAKQWGREAGRAKRSPFIRGPRTDNGRFDALAGRGAPRGALPSRSPGPKTPHGHVETLSDFFFSFLYIYIYIYISPARAAVLVQARAGPLAASTEPPMLAPTEIRESLRTELLHLSRRALLLLWSSRLARKTLAVPWMRVARRRLARRTSAPRRDPDLRPLHTSWILLAAPSLRKRSWNSRCLGIGDGSIEPRKR